MNNKFIDRILNTNNPEYDYINTLIVTALPTIILDIFLIMLLGHNYIMIFLAYSITFTVVIAHTVGYSNFSVYDLIKNSSDFVDNNDGLWWVRWVIWIYMGIFTSGFLLFLV